MSFIHKSRLTLLAGALTVATIAASSTGAAAVGIGPDIASAAATDAGGDTALQPAQTSTFDAKSVSRSPIIDGNLDDSVWQVGTPADKSIPTTDQTKPSTTQNTFDATWDYQNLYVAVHVTGDQDLVDGTNWGHGDIVSLFFDKSNHKSAPFAAGDLQLGIGLNKTDNFAPHILFGSAPGTGLTSDDQTRIADEVQGVTKPTADGWDAEVAIPWQQLGIDAYLDREIGFDLGVDNKTAALTGSSSELALWETNGRNSFWNDTSGFGVLRLDDETRQNSDSPVIYDESFDGIADGQLPANVRSASGTDGWSVRGGALHGDFAVGGAAEKRLLLPALGSDVTVDADVTFEKTVNAGRWASVVYRSAPDDSLGYYHFTNRLDGRGEITEKVKANEWKAFNNAPSPGALQQGVAYHSSVAASGQHLHHVRTGGGSPATLDLTADADQSGIVAADDLRHGGRIGVQVDQAAAAFDNIVVRQLSIDSLTVASSVPGSAKQYAEIAPSVEVALSNGDHYTATGSTVRAYSSDPSVVTVRDDGTLVTNAAGQATLTFIVGARAVTAPITVEASDDRPALTALTVDDSRQLAEHIVGQNLSLSDVSLTANTVLGTTEQLAGDDAAVTWASSDDAVVTVQDGQIVFGKKGLARLTATVAKTPASLDVWVRADDNDLVYIDEHFDENLTAGTLPTGLQLKSGNASQVTAVADGQGRALQLAPSTRVLIPNITERNDYTIEADVTYQNAANSARWGSLMYRVQNGDHPYFQMAVRQGATAANGVEFAHRNAQDQWDVRQTSSFTEAIDGSKTYHFAATVTGDRVKELIDGQQMIFTDRAGDYAAGDLGMQSDNLTMIVDNLKVTMSPADLGPVPHIEDGDVEVKQKTSKVIGTTPIMTDHLASLDDVQSIVADDATDGTLVDVRASDSDDALNVFSGDTKIGSFDDFADGAYGKTLIIARVSDQSSANRLGEVLRQRELSDVEVVSSDVQLLAGFRTDNPSTRSGLFSDRDTISQADVASVVDETNRSRSQHVILRQGAADRAVVEELQRRLLSVTVQADDTATGNAAAIASGANTIISAAPETALQVVDKLGDNALLRRIFTIGHRGIPTQAMENSISGYRTAVEKNGADMVETDVYVTKDDHVVVLHDSTFARTTDITTTRALDDSEFTGGVTRANARPSDLTLAQIEKLRLRDANGAATAEPVPTLDELLDFVKAHDVVLFLELKDPTSPAIEERTAEVVQAKQAADQVVFITFNQYEIPTMQQLLPGNSVGNLQGVGGIATGRPMETLHKALQYLTPQNAAYDPSFNQLGGNDAQSADNRTFVANAHARNLTLWGWTYSGDGDRQSFQQSLLLGINGMTTNNSDWTKDAFFGIDAASRSYQVAPGSSVTLEGSAETNVGDLVNVDAPSMVVMDGGDKVQVTGNTLTAAAGATGTATVLLQTTESIQGADFTVYSEPITVQIGQSDDGSGSGDGNGNDDGNVNGSGNGDTTDGDGDGTGTGTGNSDGISDSTDCDVDCSRTVGRDDADAQEPVAHNALATTGTSSIMLFWALVAAGVTVIGTTMLVKARSRRTHDA
ncbi:hypothetical protein F8O07_03910 [Pseudoclavibacter sp. CFCC 13796]|uniref:glycerophosphodiester phosphodiesterase family protein n=1 Tax=Pseudoclavibacter sp. CFCC 13796 TaxID=2615179 RepID=UPI0013010887|nr:glycerophosphodiester phosphodiesterase family protein [Pseudoclavibacter sp. CFCC 13796]KAB1661109.1 hypothetical protein F8O07_03910 [Pseudoclavibacter sp. CFCC 13796]